MGTESTTPLDLHIRPLQERDLPQARRIFQLAFGTFVGVPDPMQFCADRDFVTSRWRTEPAGAFAAEANGELAGSSLLSNWGSVAVFGPISIRPALWDRGVACRLLEATADLFPKWGTRLAGLFTFAQSPKHLHLYQKFGYYPRFLTAVMSTPVHPSKSSPNAMTFSQLNPGQQAGCLKSCADLTDAIYEGLDLQSEIRAVANQKLAVGRVCHLPLRTEH